MVGAFGVVLLIVVIAVVRSQGAAVARTYSGQGAGVVMFTDLDMNALWTAQITHDGGHAWVNGVDANGADLGSLAPMLSSEGVFPVNFGLERGVRGVQIDSDGSWQVEISEAADAPRWSQEAPYSGAASEVVIVDRPAVPTEVIVQHDGDGNVAVWAFDDDGDVLGLVVNEIGEFTGTAVLPADTYFVSVNTSTDTGPSSWTITP